MTDVHPRFGGTPTAATLILIDRLTEWIEDQREPFTVMDAFQATGRGSYNTTSKFIRELRDQNLLIQTNNANAKPALWIYHAHVDTGATVSTPSDRPAAETRPEHTEPAPDDTTVLLHKARLVNAGISQTQLDILLRVAQGASNAEIAHQTHRTEDTIKTHLRRTFAALKAKDRAHAVAIAYRRGLFPRDPNGTAPCPHDRTAIAVTQAVKCLMYDDILAKAAAAQAQLDTVSHAVLIAVRKTA